MRDLETAVLTSSDQLAGALWGVVESLDALGSKDPMEPLGAIAEVAKQLGRIADAITGLAFVVRDRGV
jgi:hypothetical protein